jgi:3-methyladenine DNA glycosylase Mpg
MIMLEKNSMIREIILPDKRSRLERKFFSRRSDIVAQDLLGRILVHERPDAATLYLLIKEASAYQGKIKSTSKGLLCAPGTIGISTKYGQRMLDIATGEIAEPSCVTLIGGQIYDGRGFRVAVNGPGKLTSSLEIDRNYDGLIVDLGVSPVWIGGESVGDEQILRRKKSNTPENCLGYFYLK